MPLTVEDMRMLEYFGRWKDDVERWSQWKEKRNEFQKEFPELIRAFDDMKAAEKIWKDVLLSVLEAKPVEVIEEKKPENLR